MEDWQVYAVGRDVSRACVGQRILAGTGGLRRPDRIGSDGAGSHAALSGALSHPRIVMQRTRQLALVLGTVLTCACATASANTASGTAPTEEGTLAQIYFWRARPGMAEAYSRYIREVAEPIDAEAQRRGAFVSVATYVTTDTTLPWTHMRIFVLRDSAQLRDLGAALSAAGTRLQPDSAKRRVQGEYSATLRDRVGATVTQILR